MKLLASLFLALSVSACGTPGVAAYRNEGPPLVLESYFNGRLEAWGMFQGRDGRVSKRFRVLIDARWEDGVGTLDEHFTWSDGSTSRRVWTLRRVGEGRYVGRADDVVGEALGEVAGNALRWRYVLALPVDGKVYQVDFDDWMYLVDEQVMLNRSLMSKWGFRLGEVTLAFVRR